MSGGGGDIKETEAEKAQASIALQRWNDYKNTFQPYENQYMQDVDRMQTDGEYNRVGDIALSPIASEFAKIGVSAQKQLKASGVNPNSGKFTGAIQSLSTAQAETEVDTVNRAQESQSDRYVGGLQNIVAMGQGQATTAQQGLTDVAAQSQSYAINDARNELQRKDMAGSVAGGLAGAYTNYSLNKKTPTQNSSDYGLVGGKK